MGKRIWGSALVASTAAIGLAAAPAWADWSDTFNGGLDQDWTFVGVGEGPVPLPASAGSTGGSTGLFSYSTAGDYLTLADADDSLGNGPVFIVGFVNESFTDVLVSGTVNMQTASNDNILGLVARLDPAAFNGYTLFIDKDGGDLELDKVTGGVGDGMDSADIFSFSDTGTYYLELHVTGSSTVSVVGNLWDSAAKNTLLASVGGTDAASPFLSGLSGIAGVAATNDPIATTFDNIASVPEPATLTLLASGGLLMVRRRRGKA